ncbi:MAG: hypothetical protein E6G58_11935 [Actinobacteria bacterium]|nr:MAG: hypothetical protein E6G58_11935 [Actinomycetota bacterium]
MIWAQARGALSWLIAVLALLAMSASACSGGSDGPPSSTAPSTSGSRASPVSPYGPFPYANGLQEQAFDAYLQCAAEQGVVLRGPFAPSNGKGVLFGPVPGKEITHADQAKVGKHCPQLVVGLFATPGDALHAKLFEQSATEFARCMRSHGFSDLPLPKFAPDDPYKALEGLPFEWGNPRFTAALTRCIDPLRGYVFSG